MNIEDLLEENVLYSFYGVNENFFKLGNIVFEAIEDPSDGYRSYLESIHIVKTDLVFYEKPIINLYFKVSAEGIILYDETDHVWLNVYTNHSYCYYPYFSFEYSPRIDIEEFSIELNNLDEFDPKLLYSEKFL